MIGQMAIAIALLGFNDPGRSVTPTFLFRNKFYSQLSLLEINFVTIDFVTIDFVTQLRMICTVFLLSNRNTRS